MDWCLFDFLDLSIFHLTSSLISYVKSIKTVLGWGAENVAHSCPLRTGIPTQLALGVEVKYALKTCLVTFVLDGRRRSGKRLLRNALTKTGSTHHAFQALFPLLR